MTYDYEIKLIMKIPGENAMGDPIELDEKRVVLASILDYRNKDFYQAMANGLKPSITFAINRYEYDGEKELEHGGKHYKIVDVFPVKSNRWQDESEFESIALICEGLVNK
ncbi:MAG: phage head closure protein [Tissierellaceae bacterium]|nr:phage head closure protein [Tissierellaceae bacterium]